MNEHGNRRTRKTKAQIKNSLLELLNEKNIHSITVKEICERADLNRSTFYAYYKNPYDLMMSMENDIIQDTRALLADCPALPPQEKMLYLLERHLEYIRAHIREFMAFSPEIGEDFSLPAQTMEIILTPYFRHRMQGKAANLDQLLPFCVFGTIGIVKAWVHDSMDRPVKELSNAICQLLENVIRIYE